MGEMAAQGKTVLFVGTKRQAQEAIAEEATRCRQFYVNQRWLGGLLTNMTTVQKIHQAAEGTGRDGADDAYEGRAKKEVGRLERERKHLQQNLAGIKDMNGLAGSAVRDRFEQRSDRREGSAQAGHSGGRRGRYQLRSRRSGLRDSGQRRRAARHSAVHDRRLPMPWWKAARSQPSRNSRRRRSEGDETSGEESPAEYTQYLDPKYAEQLISESMATSDEAVEPPRKGPGSEAPEELADTVRDISNRAHNNEECTADESGLMERRAGVCRVCVRKHRWLRSARN